MRRSQVPLTLALVPLAALVLAMRASAADHAADETAKTAAAVMAVDQHWLEAEESGDVAWLDGMLLPGYRSVGVAGSFATKAVILAHAGKNRGSQAMKQKVAAWQKAHPVEQQVTLQGDTAILSFVSASPATKGKLYSADIFVYVDGHWRALYSAHTELGNG
jgi:hypothetical protein